MRPLNIILILLVSLSLMTCERDDLCPETTPTTPSLNIEFFDNSIQDSPKNIFGLYIADIGNNSVLEDYNNVNTNEVTLPLKTTEDRTQFLLISDYNLNDNNTPNDTTDDIVEGNIDILTIDYQRENVYVSRACGYKTIFKNIVVTVEPGVGEPWILFTQPINDNLTIEDDTTTHYFFYH